MRMTAFWLAAILSAGLAHAQGRDAYPSRPVRMIIPAAPGGNPDVLARMLAKKLADTFGRAFVVENMPGAGGVVAAEAVVKTLPDGYTLFFGDSGALAINVAVNPGISFHPLRDFTLITALASVPTVLVVNPSVPAASLRCRGDPAENGQAARRRGLPLRAYRCAGVHGLRRRALARRDARARRRPVAELRALSQGRRSAGRGLSRRHLRYSPLPRQPAQHVASRRQL